MSTLASRQRVGAEVGLRARTREGLGLLEAVIDEIAERVAARLELAPEPADEPWHLLNLEEAAGRLGRSTRWVRDRVKVGELAFVRLDGGALAFELDDLRAFVEERRVACSPLAGLEESLHRGTSNGSRRAAVQKVEAGEVTARARP
jgi:hypothetical protein